jgi:hypothetical protein
VSTFQICKNLKINQDYFVSKYREYTLNLRNHVFLDLSNLQNEVELALDQFLKPFIKSNSKTRKITIIVGRGLNSARFISGKNPLRFYTEVYLGKTGFDWKNNALNPAGIPRT